MSSLNKKAVDWLSPTMLVVIILAILLGLSLFLYIWKLKKGILP